MVWIANLNWLTAVPFILALVQAVTLRVAPTVSLCFGCIAVGAGVYTAIEMKRREVASRRWVWALVAALGSVVIAYWSIDAPAIPNDHTVADLRAASPECDSSYDILCRLNDEDPNSQDAPEIGLSAQDVETLRRLGCVVRNRAFQEACQAMDQNAPEIVLLWDRSQKGRQVIDELAGFPEISDPVAPEFGRLIPFMGSVRDLTFIYANRCCLQALRGHSVEAVHELAKLQSFAMRFNLNCRTMVSKLLCVAVTAVNMEVASFIVNCPETPDTVVTELAKDFGPLRDDDVSMNNALINEYLEFQGAIGLLERQGKVRGIGGGYPGLKRNSVLRLYRNLIGRYQGKDARPLRVWPQAYPDLKAALNAGCRLPWYYTLYNPVGAQVATILTPALDKVMEIRTKWQVHNDLLQIVINHRLGRPVNLKARAYGDTYVVDLEQQMIFSPGPDGMVGTKDDIKVMINRDCWNRSPGGE